jgi:hypothetical protein
MKYKYPKRQKRNSDYWSGLSDFECKTLVDAINKATSKSLNELKFTGGNIDIFVRPNGMVENIPVKITLGHS